MSRAEERRRRRERGVAPPAPARARSSRRRPLLAAGGVALGLALLAAVAWFAGGREALQRASAPRSPADSAARLDLEGAYALASWRLLHDDPAGSLPYYRRVRDVMSADSWEFHFEYGVALENAALAKGQRSSFERQALATEALAEFHRAADGCPDREKLAKLLVHRGLLASIWGFPLESFLDCELALEASPSSEGAKKSLESLRAQFARPEAPSP
jgi:hypothetical protein